MDEEENAEDAGREQSDVRCSENSGQAKVFVFYSSSNKSFWKVSDLCFQSITLASVWK